MTRPHLSMLDRLLAPVITAVGVGLIVSTAVAYLYTRSAVEDLSQGQASQAVMFLERELEQQLRVMVRQTTQLSREEVLSLALEDTYLGRSARNASLRTLEGYVSGGIFTRINVINANGTLILSTRKDMPTEINLGDRSFFRLALAGRSSLETLLRSRVSSTPILAATVPLPGPDGKPAGVVAGVMDLRVFSKEILDQVRIGRGGGAYILNADGQLLAAPTWASPGEFDPGGQARSILLNAFSGKIWRYTRLGTERLCAIARNPDTGWILVVEADADEVLAPARKLGAVSGGLAALIVAAVALALAGLRRSVDRLRQSEERFAKLFRLSPEAVMLVDLEGQTLADVNDAFVQTTGHARDEVIGRTTLDIGLYTDEAARQEIYRQLGLDGHIENLEFEGRRKDGSLFTGSTSAQLLELESRKYVLVMMRDITETKRMQEMMIQTEKMISVGGIAAGIAHEINNPLGIVLQAAQNLAQRTRPDFPRNLEAAAGIGLDMNLLQDYMRARKIDVFIQDIRTAAQRAAAIIRHMLDFSRRSEVRRAPCDLAAVVDRAVDLASSDYDLKKSYDFRRIRIERDYDPELSPVECTETEIEQVCLNLLRNSAQALGAIAPPEGGPCIRIRLTRLGRAGARLEIGDNGPGIPPEIQRRIFEPFFTTKPPGVGTGLGLSVSYFIVTKGHGGAMSVSSRPGQGATFTIDLPGARQEQES